VAAVAPVRAIPGRALLAIGQAEELVDALVELVIAHAVVVELHEVEGLDGRLVVEEGRQ
jgi:hypothetical protein